MAECITVEPGKRGGRRCVRRIRITVGDVLELMSDGVSHEQVLKQMPDLERDDVVARLAYDQSSNSAIPLEEA